MELMQERNFDRKSIKDADHEEATFEIYVLVFRLVHEGKMTAASATSILGRMLGSFTNAWHVVGITKSAFDLFEPREPKCWEKPKKLQRAHIFGRNETVKEMLSSQLSRARLFENWRQRDKTIIGVSTENHGILETQAYFFDNPEGTFFQNKAIGSSGGKKFYKNFHEWISHKKNRGELVRVADFKAEMLSKMSN